MECGRDRHGQGERIITRDGSRVKVAMVEADEELAIARDTWAVVTGGKQRGQAFHSV